MDSGNWTNFLIKWKSNIEMPNPLKSEKKNLYTEAKRHQTIELECVLLNLFRKIEQFTSLYIHIYSPADANLNDDDWIQSSMRKFDSHAWNIYLSIWISYRKPSYKNINFRYLVGFYLGTATATQFVTTRYFYRLEKM